MIPIDIKSVLLANCVTFFIATLLFGLVWRQNRERFEGISDWMRFHLAAAVGVLFILLKDTFATVPLILTGNTLIVLGIVFLNNGFQSFFGLKASQKPRYVLTALFALIHLYFTLASPNLAARTINLSLALTLLNMEMVWLFIKIPTKQRTGALHLFLLSTLLLIVANLSRIGINIFSPSASDLFLSGPANGIVIICYQFILFATTFCLTLIINRRLISQFVSIADSHALKSGELDKLVRELNCLYTLSQLEESDNKPVEELLQNAGRRIVESWEGRANLRTQIVYNNRTFQSEGFCETPFRQTIPLRVFNREVGRVDLFLVQESDAQVGPKPEFLPEDTPLLAEIAARISRILERRQTLEDLHQRQRDLSVALNAAKMGTWHWNIKLNRREFNDDALKMLGLDPLIYDERVESFFAIVHPEDRETIRKAIQLSLEFGVPYGVTYRAVWPDGTVHRINSRGRIACNANEEPEHISGIIWEVTDGDGSSS
jgi:PAS domain-containing protein